MKRIFIVFSILLCSACAAAAQSRHEGDCNVLIQTIQSVKTWKENDIPLARILQIVRRDIDKTSIGAVATDSEKVRWDYLTKQVYMGQSLSDDLIANYVGRLCKPPYSVVANDVFIPQQKISDTIDGRCVLIGSLAEKAAIARDEKKSIYTAFSNEKPFNEIDFNHQKAIILMVSNVGDLMYSRPRIVAEKMFSECHENPDFLEPLVAIFPNK